MVYIGVRGYLVTVIVSELSVSGSETYLLSHIQSYRFVLLFHLLGQEPHRLIPCYCERIYEEVK